MSLVAYASSEDESDLSDTEKASKSDTSSVIKVTDPPISDEEDFTPSNEDYISGLSLPVPQYAGQQIKRTVMVEKKSENNDFLATLPKPKTGSTLTPKEDELEDFVKKTTKQLKATVEPHVKPKSQKRKIIQISVPEVTNSDSDDEQPQTKKAVQLIPSKKKCGLFSVLPAPKNKPLGAGKETHESGKMFAETFMQPKSAIMSEAPSKGTKAIDSQYVTVASKPTLPSVKSSAPFVPASVTRKPKQSSRSAFNLETGMMMAQSRKNVPKSQAESSSIESRTATSSVKNSTKHTAAVRLSGVPLDVDSSDDEGTDQSTSSNFFSLGSSTTGSNPLSASSLSVTSSVSALPSVGNKDSENMAELPSPSLQDQPLSFKSRDGSLNDAPTQFKSMAARPSAHSYGSGFSNMYNNADYNMAGVGSGDSEGQEVEPMGQGAEQYEGTSGAFAQDEEFLKMQGKSKRGKEQINIIDVRQDDQIAEVDLNLIKNLSEESANRASHSKKKNDDMPTSQQRKKHQITYLAFKAKEREVELKDAWAASRQTKRQTQSKYGF